MFNKKQPPLMSHDLAQILPRNPNMEVRLGVEEEFTYGTGTPAADSKEEEIQAIRKYGNMLIITADAYWWGDPIWSKADPTTQAPDPCG